MLLIAHRGLFQGPNKSLENKPEQIMKALLKGYDCEIDLWVVNSELWLGHDGPQYPIIKDFLDQPGLWIHAKNLEALHWLTGTDYNYFWHQNDSFVITSYHFIWTFPENKLTDRSIMLMPEWANPELKGLEDVTCYGICSDYVELIASTRNQQ